MFMQYEQNIWYCDVCRRSGRVAIPLHAGVIEGLGIVTAAHRKARPGHCQTDIVHVIGPETKLEDLPANIPGNVRRLMRQREKQ